MRLLGVIAALFAAAVSAAVPALAITGGQQDGTAHPNVGLIVDGAGTPLCSSVLVAPSVAVTAAHCFGSDRNVSVSFDSVVDPGQSTFVRGRAVVDPQYGLDKKDSHDIAVVLLDRPVLDVVPATLPAPGSAGSLAAGIPVTNVGYGFDSAKTPVFDGTRRWSTSTLASVGATTIAVKLRTGGVCFGDSGGAHFVGGALAAIVSTGNKSCTGQSTGYRLDTPSVRAFLAPYVTLP